MIRIALNNLGLDPHQRECSPAQSPIGLLQTAADLGFEAAQFTAAGEQDTAVLRAFNSQQLGKTAVALGIPMSLHHHAFFPLPTVPHYLDKDEWYQRIFSYLKAAVDLVRSTGGDLVTFHPPQNLREQDLQQGAVGEEIRHRALQSFAVVVREVGEYAAARGVLLGIEAICFPEQYPGGTVFKSPEEIDAFLNIPGMPDSVGLQVDMTHFHHKGQDLCAILEHWRERLWDVHTSDCIIHHWRSADQYVSNMLDEVHWPVGRGSIDFPAVIQTLKKIEYDRWLTLELYPQHVATVQDILDSRKLLLDLLA